MELRNVRHNWHEAAGFSLNRPEGTGEYILLHFHTAVELSFGGRQQYCAPAGTLVVFGPDTPHGFISHGPLLHDWMHLTGDVRGELAAFGVPVDEPVTIAQGRPVTERIARLESEFFARGLYWERCVRAVLDELWILIAREMGGETERPVAAETAALLRALRAEMILHPERPWTNEMMARQLNISVSRLYPLYRRMFSISPGQDLILMRVEKAKNMLRQGLSVSQIAEQLGYSSTCHFIRQFKQCAGVTPGQWGSR